jgi:hypothetical protein
VAYFATENRSGHLRFSCQPVNRRLFLLGLVVACSSGFASINANRASLVQLVDTTGQSYFADAHPYLEEPLEQLIREIPELKGLEPAEGQDELPMILRGTGRTVEAFFERIVDVVAHEQVKQERIDSKGKTTANRQLRYDYLILIHRDEEPPRVDEYRMDANGNSAQQEGLVNGYSITSGFALKCIHFLPGLRSDSTFRHLGVQTIDGRETYVVAFAQRAGRSTVTTHITGIWGTVVVLVQGIAWVDRSTFQILRMRTDLLAPRADIGLEQQTTQLRLDEVQLPGVPQPLWRPSEVQVNVRFNGQYFRNEHRYREYKLFHVSAKIVAPAN